jgi:enterobactin synthetase component D
MRFLRQPCIAYRCSLESRSVRRIGGCRSASLLHSSIPTTATSCYERLFDVQVPEGRCVGLQLIDAKNDDTTPDALTSTAILASSSHWIYEKLHRDEIQYGLNLTSESNQISFWLGRLAMREALGNGIAPCVILKDSHGRPRVPPGYLGSISHKRNTGVALVLESTDKLFGIGVDVEETKRQGKLSVARKVLTPKEQRDLGRLPGISSDEEVLLRFSLKEALYKAVHPLLCQYISFQEAEVYPKRDGTADLVWLLESGAHCKIDKVTAHWERHGDLFLTTGSVLLKDEYEHELERNENSFV